MERLARTTRLTKSRSEAQFVVNLSRLSNVLRGLPRYQILKAHPEISSLMGPCPWTKYQVLFVVLLQVRAMKDPWGVVRVVRTGLL